MPQLEFLVAGEYEFTLPESNELVDFQSHMLGYRLLDSGTISPPINKALMLRDVRQAAAEMLSTLRPQNDYEATRLADWKEQAEGLTETDAINFLIYKGVSDPCITTKQSSLTMVHDDVTRLHGSKDIEFRFGPALSQEGYYDKPGISEIRLTPRSADTYFPRRTILFNRVAETAAMFGRRVLVASEHINISAFEGQRPYFNDPDQDISPYRKAAAGLIRLYLDGALYDSTKQPHTPLELIIGPWRETDIRVIPGRLEMRTKNNDYPRLLLGLDQRRSLRFLLGGLRYGLLHATDEDQQRVRVTQTLATSPGPGYNRAQDLPLQRFLTGIEVEADGRTLHLANSSHPFQAFGRLAGVESLSPDRAQQQLLVSGLELAHGQARITPEGYRHFLGSYQVSRERWETRGIDNINQILGRIAAKPATTVVYHGTLSPQHKFSLRNAATSVGLVDPERYAELEVMLGR